MVRVAILVFCAFLGTSEQVAAQGRPARDFFVATDKTTPADAHDYLKRVMATFRLRDQFESSTNEHRFRGYVADKSDPSGCKARLSIESTRTAKVAESTTTKLTDYFLEFNNIVDVQGSDREINIVGRIRAESASTRTAGRFETTPGTPAVSESKSVYKGLKLYLESSPYDAVKALAFLSHKCGGGARFTIN